MEAIVWLLALDKFLIRFKGEHLQVLRHVVIVPLYLLCDVSQLMKLVNDIPPSVLGGIFAFNLLTKFSKSIQLLSETLLCISNNSVKVETGFFVQGYLVPNFLNQSLLFFLVEPWHLVKETSCYRDANILSLLPSVRLCNHFLLAGGLRHVKESLKLLPIYFDLSSEILVKSRVKVQENPLNVLLSQK